MGLWSSKPKEPTMGRPTVLDSAPFFSKKMLFFIAIAVIAVLLLLGVAAIMMIVSGGDSGLQEVLRIPLDSNTLRE